MSAHGGAGGDGVTQIINGLLTHEKGPSRFSQEAGEELLALEEDYIVDLATEAVRIARRSKLDDVARTHVREAHVHLNRASGDIPWTEIVASLFGGALIQQIVDTTSQATVTRSEVWWILGLAAPTMILFILAAARRR